MQRPTENLHRATPVPTTDPFSYRRASATLSVGSIPEEDGEDLTSSASVNSDRTDQRGWQSKLGKQSPNQPGRAFADRSIGQLESFKSKDLPVLKPSSRKPFSLSAQSSPTGSVDSQGSGTTARSHDGLHRPTPIPSDAANSFAMGGSFAKRSSGRLQPSTPTINELEDQPYDFLDSDPGPDALVRNESLGGKSTSSLHRATPVPSDLASSSGSGGKLQAHRLSTPTIQENEVDRGSELDSSDHYYGRPQRLEDLSATYNPPNGSTSDRLPSARPEVTRDPDQPAADPGDETRQTGKASPARPIPHVRNGEVQRTTATEGVATSSPASTAAQSQGHSSSPFSPFVDSKDWERDILGVARFLRMCPGLSRQLIGDILGENNERCLRVLECFTASFDFSGLSFEAALREYLESFCLPGESQKIYRILESWSRQFFRQCPGIFRTADAVLVLAFSLVLLNTDKHNRTVKQKMTCAQFLRNNKGTNGGQDFPVEFLEELYRNIERRAIRMPPAHHAENPLQRNSLPEPLRATQEQYESPKKARPSGFLCF